MHTLKRLLAATLLLIALSRVAAAQSEMMQSGRDMIGIGIKGLLPTGDFANTHHIGFGVSGMDEFVISDQFGISVELSYMRWAAKDNPILQAGQERESVRTSINLTAGPRYYFGMFYASIEAGLFYGTRTFTLVGGTSGEQFSESYRFGVVPGVGLHFGVLELSAEYSFVADLQWLTLRAGVYFLRF